MALSMSANAFALSERDHAHQEMRVRMSGLQRQNARAACVRLLVGVPFDRLLGLAMKGSDLLLDCRIHGYGNGAVRHTVL